MSAVMSTLSMISGGRRAHRKLTSSRKSGQFSDAGEDRSRSQHDLNKQRSASLQTLEAGGAINLDNLEAKMASIEVSLSGPRRRSAGPRDGSRELDALRAALADKDTLIQSLKKQLNASLSAARLAAQASSPTPGTGREDAPALSADERLALEERATSVRDELDTRRANIQELKRRLEKTHVTENIDSRIEQAELQYQVGREELELLTLGEQARALALLMEQADAARARRTTLYSAVRECGGGALLVAAEARDGAWSAALRGATVSVDWTEHPALEHGDRVLEINGTSTLWCSADELRRAVAAAAPSRLVLLRAQPQSADVCSLRAAAARAGRAERELRGDNTRLTHRISYLEDQVAEMLTRHPQLQPTNGSDGCITVNKTKKNVTNINITSEPQSKTSPKSEIQVFQKGPDITAIVAKLPGLNESEGSALPVVRPRSALSANARDQRTGRTMRHSLSHHCIHDYGAETDAAIRMIERNRRHMDEQKIKTEKYNRSKADDRLGSEDEPDAGGSRTDECDSGRKGTKKTAERIEESIKKTNWAERKTLSIIEQLKRSQRLRKMKKSESAENSQAETERHHVYGRIDGKVLENAHKSSRRSSKLHSRSAKSSEFESECSDYPNGEARGGSRGGSQGGHYVKREEPREERCRPPPPRKPLRLSLHRARSAHSLVAGSESEASRPPSEAGPHCKRPVKRTHAADRWAHERPRDPRATPRPTRRAPPADGLYPDGWC